MARLWTQQGFPDMTPDTALRQYKMPRLAMRAREGLRKVALGEAQTITGWLEYGGALNEGRALHKSNELFGQWVKGNLPETEQKDREAAMWAAANPAAFATVRVLNPKVRTVRGLHAKFKEGQLPSPAQRHFISLQKFETQRSYMWPAHYPPVAPGGRADASG